MKTMYLALEFNAKNFLERLMKDHTPSDVMDFMKELCYEYDVAVEPRWEFILRRDAVADIVANFEEPESEADILADIMDCQADDKIKEMKGE